MSYHRISVIQSNRECHLAMGESRALSRPCQNSMAPTTIYRTCRRTSFFRRRRFLRFWTIKLTFITFACKNHYFMVDWSRRASPVKRSIDLRLIRDLPLILGIWLKFLLRLICGHKLHIFGQSSGDPIIPNDL